MIYREDSQCFTCIHDLALHPDFSILDGRLASRLAECSYTQSYGASSAALVPYVRLDFMLRTERKAVSDIVAGHSSTNREA